MTKKQEIEVVEGALARRQAKVFDWKTKKWADRQVPVLSDFSSDAAAGGAIFQIPSLHNGTPIELSARHIITAAAAGGVEVTQTDVLRLLEFACVHKLSPALGEMYFFKSKGRLSIGVSAEAYLRRANNCPDYRGLEQGWIVCGRGGKGRKYLKPNEDVSPDVNIIGSWAKAYREGYKTPIGEAMFAEYDKKRDAWCGLKETMIKKVARSIALRLAFPAQMGNLYTQEEMPGESVQFPESADDFNESFPDFHSPAISESPPPDPGEGEEGGVEISEPQDNSFQSEAGEDDSSKPASDGLFPDEDVPF